MTYEEMQELVDSIVDELSSTALQDIQAIPFDPGEDPGIFVALPGGESVILVVTLA